MPDETLYDRMTSRKLWVSVGFEVLTSFLLIIDKIQASNWEAVTMVILGGYLAANVVAKKKAG